MHLLVEAGPGQLCEARRIMRISLVRLHHLEAPVGLARIDAHDRDAQLVQATRNPWRHPVGLDHHAVHGQKRGDRFRRAVHALRCDLAPFGIDNADVRRFHRQVYSGIVLHTFRSDNQKVRRSVGPGKQPQITR